MGPRQLGRTSLTASALTVRPRAAFRVCPLVLGANRRDRARCVIAPSPAGPSSLATSAREGPWELPAALMAEACRPARCPSRLSVRAVRTCDTALGDGAVCCLRPQEALQDCRRVRFTDKEMEAGGCCSCPTARPVVETDHTGPKPQATALPPPRCRQEGPSASFSPWGLSRRETPEGTAWGQSREGLHMAGAG